VALCLSQLETVESGDIRDFRFGLEIDGGLGGGGGDKIHVERYVRARLLVVLVVTY
jgi:hypothetical protein